MSTDYKKVKAIEQTNKKRFLAVNPALTEDSGIYVLFRKDEAGIKYAYVGQAKHVLSRLAQHLTQYQHIDLSLKKHGLYSKDNMYGWQVIQLNFPERLLDEKEQEYIVRYANAGFQLRNKTSGGQGKGKAQIDEYKASKGYREGIERGRKTLAKELSAIIEKHLVVSVKEEKRGNKISIQQLEKFNELLRVDD